MLRPIILLIMSMSVSACSTQGRTWVAEQLLEVAFDIVLGDDSPEYDESQIFPSPNQRLACQLDANCKTPLSEFEYWRLDAGDQLLVLYGDNHQPWQIEEQTSVQLSSDFQEYLRRQSEVNEHVSKQVPIVFRDPNDATKPQSGEPGELWR